MTRPDLWWSNLGPVPFADADFLQSELAERRTEFEPDLLIFAEHPPVYTYGARAEYGGMLWPPEFLKSRGIDAVLTSRGGNPVYHAPGQLAGYAIYNTNTHELAARSFVALIERALMLVLKDFRIVEFTPAKAPGLWVEGHQLVSIGVHLSRGISRYGFTLNVNPDLSPCEETPTGRLEVTSLERLGARTNPCDLAPRIAAAFGVVFHQKVRRVEPDELKRLSRE